MKNLFFIAVLSVAAIATTFAQVPDDITNNFNTQYPGTSNATWTLEGDYYRVSYSDSLNRENSILYDKQGNVSRRSMTLNPAEVPSSINEYYAKTYPNETNYSIRRETDGSGKISYYGSTGAGNTLYFDDRGNYVRTGKAGTGTK